MLKIALIIIFLAAVLLLLIFVFIGGINLLFKPKNEKYWHVSDKPKQDNTDGKQGN